MANPALIETGLDLVAFATLVYLGIPTYSIYTVEQSKRRSWRLGQTEPVHVHFFVYGGTVQQAAINLLSDKARAADLVHGDVSRGLAALNAPAHDFLTELTQQVMSGQAEDAMASWKPEVRSKDGRDPRVKTVPSMAEVVLALARKHDVDFDRVGAHLKLSLGAGWDPLSVERIGAGEVAVSHTFVQNGDVVFDPEITFFTGYGDDAWVPTSITQPPVLLVGQDGSERVLGGYRCVAWVRGGELADADVAGVAELAEFAEMWARNIRAQGWLERGEVVRAEEVVELDVTETGQYIMPLFEEM
jgi:hypothetical protein